MVRQIPRCFRKLLVPSTSPWFEIWPARQHEIHGAGPSQLQTPKLLVEDDQMAITPLVSINNCYVAWRVLSKSVLEYPNRVRCVRTARGNDQN